MLRSRQVSYKLLHLNLNVHKVILNEATPAFQEDIDWYSTTRANRYSGFRGLLLHFRVLYLQNTCLAVFAVCAGSYPHILMESSLQYPSVTSHICPVCCLAHEYYWNAKGPRTDAPIVAILCSGTPSHVCSCSASSRYGVGLTDNLRMRQSCPMESRRHIGMGTRST